MDRLERLERMLEEVYPEVKRQRSDLELLKEITSDLVLGECPPFCVNSIIAYPQIKSRAGRKLKANP